MSLGEQLFERGVESLGHSESNRTRVLEETLVPIAKIVVFVPLIANKDLLSLGRLRKLSQKLGRRLVGSGHLFKNLFK